MRWASSRPRRGGRRSRSDLAQRRRRAAGEPRRSNAPTHRDDAAMWLFSGGTTGPPEGGGADPSLVREHHRALRQRRARLPRERRHALGAQALLRLRDRLEPVLPVLGRRHGRAVPRARPRADVLFDADPPPPSDHPDQRADDGQPDGLPSGRAASRISRRCASPPRPARRCRSSCTSAGSETFGVELLDGLGTAEMWHIFISNRPGARAARHARHGRARLRDQGAATRTAASCPPARSGGCGCAAARARSATGSSMDSTAGGSAASGTSPATWCRIDADGYVTYCGRGDEMLKVAGKWLRAAGGRGLPAASTRRCAECAVVGVADAGRPHQAAAPTWWRASRAPGLGRRAEGLRARAARALQAPARGRRSSTRCRAPTWARWTAASCGRGGERGDRVPYTIGRGREPWTSTNWSSR